MVALTTQQNDTLNVVNDALRYGFEKMSQFPFVMPKYRNKKVCLYLMMCAQQSYMEAVVKLITPPVIYDKAAEVILRSMIENLINMVFVYSSRTQKNAVIFLANSLQDKNDFADKYKGLMTKYPSWNLEFSHIKTVADWDLFITKNASYLNKIEKRYNLRLPRKLPDLRGRATMSDDYLKHKGKFKEKGSLEKLYVLFYKYFSQKAHLTMPGLEEFWDKAASQVIIDGKAEDFERVLSVSYQFYITMLHFCLHQFKLYKKEEFLKFNDLSRAMVRE